MDDLRKELCLKVSGYGFFSQDVWDDALDYIIAFSAILDLLVAYSVFGHSKTRVHPATMVGLISLIDGFYCYLGLSRHVICDTDTASNLFAYTVYYSDGTYW